MRSDLVQYSHRNDKITLIDIASESVKPGAQNWFDQQFLQNIFGFKNWYACEYILFLIVY